MTRVALRGLRARKLRTALTALAIVLGVAMVSGTLVLTDTIDKAFSAIFSSSYEETDAVISGSEVVGFSASGKPTVPEALLAEVRALPGVETAAGSLVDLSGSANQAKLLDRDGDIIGSGGNPTFGFGVDPAFPQFNPMELTEGAWASGPAEVVIDAASAEGAGFGVGDRIRVAAEGPVRAFTIVGLARFGGVDSLGGATLALFDNATAREVIGKTGFDLISVAARPGVSDAELLGQIRPLLPDTAQLATGAEQAATDTAEIAGFIDIIRYFLLAFGGIALLVGGLVIFNTLSITVAQRTRELATLRTLGASRRQVLRSVVIEALAIGLSASLVGLGLGLALAKGLTAIFAALGGELPQAGTVLAPRTIVVALLAGTLVTVLAGLMPAVRATRIAPVAAVREGAVVAGRRSTLGVALSLGLVALAGAALVAGTLVDGLDTTTRVTALVGGALGVVVGIALVAPLAVRPLARLVGWPAERLAGPSGRLARYNVVANPGRTASTAAALMIGLMLVTFVAVLGAALKDANDAALSDQLRADYVLSSDNGFEALPLAAGRALERDGLTVSGVRGDRARVAGADTNVSGIDPSTIGDVYTVGVDEPAIPGLDGLDSGSGGAILRADFAESHDLAVGDALAITTPAGSTARRSVVGVYAPSRFTPLLGEVLISQSDFDATFPQPRDTYTLVAASGGASAQTTNALQEALAQFPNGSLQTHDEFIETNSGEVDELLNLLYVMLALSVVVSLLGIVNTLALSVFERTREIGMLRAVGMTRRGARRMVRHESVIIALIGAALGMSLGIGAGALVIRSLSKYEVGFALPVRSLVAFVVVAILAGVLAAALPARRAGRLNVLRALQYE